MALDSLVRSLIGTAAKIAAPFAVIVQMTPWTGSDTYGNPTFGASVPLSVFLTVAKVRVKLSSGDVVQQKASFDIPSAVTPNGATGREEPIDPRDTFTLPSGEVCTVLDVRGPMDPATSAPFVTTVVLG